MVMGSNSSQPSGEASKKNTKSSSKEWDHSKSCGS